MKPEFINQYTVIQPSLQSFIVSQVPNLSDAEDLLQEVALVLWNKFENFDSEKAQFRTWAFGVAKYEILNHKRKHARGKVIFNETLMETISAHCQVTFEEDCHQKDALKSCLKEMSDENRDILVYYYFQKTSCEGIAEKLKRKLAAVYTQLHRLRDVLRRCINTKTSPGVE